MRIQLKIFKGDAQGRACMITALETGSKLDFVDASEDEQRAVNGSAQGHHTSAQSMPPMTLPSMDDNGFYLWESRAIMQYLAHRDNAIYPNDPIQRAKIDAMLFFDASCFSHAMEAYVNPVVFLHCAPAAGAREAVCAALQKLEAALSKTAYVAGHTFSIADIALYAATSSLELVQQDKSGDSFDLQSDYPNLKKWYEEIKAREHTVAADAFFADYKKVTAEKTTSVLRADVQAAELWQTLDTFMRKVFAAADRDGNGMLDRHELSALVQKVFKGMMRQVYQDMALDLPASLKLSEEEVSSYVKAIFDSVDGDGDERVTFDEIREASDNMGFTREALTAELVDYPSSTSALTTLLTDDAAITALME